MAKSTMTHCPNCGSAWTNEEQHLKECYDCGYPECEPLPILKPASAPQEWDTDDDEAMPNTFKR